MTAYQVLTFASYAEAFGRASLQVNLPEAATVEDLIHALRALPGGAVLPDAPLVAVNRRLAEPGDPLGPADELALLPPLAGG